VAAPVRFEVSCQDAYDYLVAPANRPEWQSSLKAVADVVGPDGVVGQSWDDVTTVGIRPRMELTDADRPHRWSEHGTWRGFRASLTLTFTPVGSFCDVCVAMHVSASGLALPLGVAANRVAPMTVRSDLRRAAKILARR
jgi:hypothetical protein